MELGDRERMLLAFAVAGHGIAARPEMPSEAAGLAAELGSRRRAPAFAVLANVA
jgi:hypothetical protein